MSASVVEGDRCGNPAWRSEARRRKNVWKNSPSVNFCQSLKLSRSIKPPERPVPRWVFRWNPPPTLFQRQIQTPQRPVPQPFVLWVAILRSGKGSERGDLVELREGGHSGRAPARQRGSFLGLPCGRAGLPPWRSLKVAKVGKFEPGNALRAGGNPKKGRSPRAGCFGRAPGGGGRGGRTLAQQRGSFLGLPWHGPRRSGGVIWGRGKKRIQSIHKSTTLCIL